MTFKEFVAAVEGLNVSYESELRINSNSYFNSKVNSVKGPLISTEWSTGGAQGGSCWGGEAQAYTEEVSLQEMELKYLDVILLHFWEDMPYLHYKNITSEIVHEYHFTSNDYYGNYTDYSGRYVLLEDLYNYLKKHNKL